MTPARSLLSSFKSLLDSVGEIFCFKTSKHQNLRLVAFLSCQIVCFAENGLLGSTESNFSIHSKRAGFQIKELCADPKIVEHIELGYAQLDKTQVRIEQKRRQHQLARDLRQFAIQRFARNKNLLLPELAYHSGRTLTPLHSSCAKEPIANTQGQKISYDKYLTLLAQDLKSTRHLKESTEILSLGKILDDRLAAIVWHGMEAAILQDILQKRPWKGTYGRNFQPYVYLSFKEQTVGPASTRLALLRQLLPILSREADRKITNPFHIRTVADQILQTVTGSKVKETRQRVLAKVAEYKVEQAEKPDAVIWQQYLELTQEKERGELDAGETGMLAAARDFLAWHQFFASDLRPLILAQLEKLDAVKIGKIQKLLGSAASAWLDEIETSESGICASQGIYPRQNPLLLSYYLQGKKLNERSYRDLSVVCAPGSLTQAFRTKKLASTAAAVRTTAYAGMAHTLVKGPKGPVTLATAGLFALSYGLQAWDSFGQARDQSALFGMHPGKRLKNRLVLLYQGTMMFLAPGMTYGTAMILKGQFNHLQPFGQPLFEHIHPGWHFFLPNSKDVLTASITTAQTAFSAGKQFLNQGRNPLFSFPFWADLAATYMSTIWTLGPLNVKDASLEGWVLKFGVSLTASFGAYFLMDDSISGVQTWSMGKTRDPKFVEYVIGWVPKYTVGHMMAKGFVKATLGSGNLLAETVSAAITYTYYCFSYASVATFFENPDLSIDETVSIILKKFRDDPKQMLFGWIFQSPGSETKEAQPEALQTDPEKIWLKTDIDPTLVKDLVQEMLADPR